MKKLNALLIFYRKIAVPSLIFAAIIGVMGNSMADFPILRGMLVSYALLSPLFHYFSYDVMHPNEYYFYNNLGLSKKLLWFSTLIVGFVLFIISQFI